MKSILSLALLASLAGAGAARSAEPARVRGSVGPFEVNAVAVAGSEDATRLMVRLDNGQVWVFPVDASVSRQLDKIRAGDSVTLSVDRSNGTSHTVRRLTVQPGTTSVASATRLPFDVPVGAPVVMGEGAGLAGVRGLGSATSPGLDTALGVTGMVGVTATGERAPVQPGHETMNATGISAFSALVVPTATTPVFSNGFAGNGNLAATPSNVTGVVTTGNGIPLNGLVNGGGGVVLSNGTVGNAGFLPGTGTVITNNGTTTTLAPTSGSVVPSNDRPVITGPFTPGTVVPGVTNVSVQGTTPTNTNATTATTTPDNQVTPAQVIFLTPPPLNAPANTNGAGRATTSGTTNSNANTNSNTNTNGNRNP